MTMAKKLISALISCFFGFSVLTLNVNAEEAVETNGIETEELQQAEDEKVTASVNTERSDEGTAYAIVTDDGELVFFRSNNSYSNNRYTLATDIMGNTLQGTVYTGIETKQFESYNSPWYSRRASIKNVRIADGQIIRPKYMTAWFQTLSQVEYFHLDGLDTSNTLAMNDLFCNCFHVKELDLRNFDTSKVTDMSAMFLSCMDLYKLDISSFDTSNVTDMSLMFLTCMSLDSIDVSHFDTGKVTTFHNMFGDCYNVKELDVSNFDTGSVTEMSSMFSDCRTVKTLDLSSFDTGNVVTMNEMFSHCKQLTNVDLSSFDTSNVIDMNLMFQDTPKLTSLDLSSFDTGKAYMNRMFEGTDSLQSITLGKGFTKWSNNNYLPSGTWINTSVNKALTEKELYDQYPSHASEWAGTWVKQFSDVSDPKAYYYSPVYWALQNGITVGAGGPGKFSPNSSCTREQIVTFLWRFMGEPEPKTASSFSDVKETDWFYKPITWAFENKITTGLNDGTGRFGVGQPCTREQCVTFLYRTAGYPEVTIHKSFTDVRPDAYYYDSISWAASKDITVGLNDGTGRFGVGQKCTRAMVVTFLYRFAEVK